MQKVKKLSSLSIFLPCLNDGKILPYMLTKIYAVAPLVAKEFEVIIIENGSQKETLDILSLLKKQYPPLRVISFNHSLGFGGALIEGYRHATKDWIFYTNGDGQYDPMELVSLAAKCTDSIDIVYGYRVKRGDKWYRGIVGNTYRKIIQTRFRTPVHDINCDFRLIKKSVIDKITLTKNSGVIHLELILKLHRIGARFVEVGVSHFPRPVGTSEFFRLPHLVKTFQDYWNFKI